MDKFGDELIFIAEKGESQRVVLLFSKFFLTFEN